MYISVLLPVYNEAENLLAVTQELTSTLNTLGKDFEIIIVDDGSTDSSPQIIETLSQKNSHIKAVLFRSNRGQSAAFDAGFRYSTGDLIVTMDADGQNDPGDIPRMIQYLESENLDFVTGWRKNRKDGMLLRKIPSKIANAIILNFMKTPINDLGCSLKLYRSEIAKELRLYGEMHRFISVLAEGLGARVGELEVHHRPRMAGVSKYGLNRTFKVILDLITVWFMRSFQTKPIYIFGGFGFFMLAMSFLLALIVLYQKFSIEAWVHRNPLFIISTIFSVIGIQFIASGLLAEMIVRTYFESQSKPTYVVAKVLNLPAKLQL